MEKLVECSHGSKRMIYLIWLPLVSRALVSPSAVVAEWNKDTQPTDTNPFEGLTYCTKSADHDYSTKITLLYILVLLVVLNLDVFNACSENKCGGWHLKSDLILNKD